MSYSLGSIELARLAPGLTGASDDRLASLAGDAGALNGLRLATISFRKRSLSWSSADGSVLNWGSRLGRLNWLSKGCEDRSFRGAGGGNSDSGVSFAGGVGGALELLVIVRSN